MHITELQIALRLGLALLIGGSIGFEREFKNRPAGMKTHILVCMGACVIALIQREIGYQALATAIANPKLIGVVRSDQARLIAQVVSGVGFLGAGTIIVTKRSVVGLTTAASIWAVAGVGIACGMGYYRIAILSAVFFLGALLLTNRMLQRLPMSKKIEVKYAHKRETQEAIQTYFMTHHVKVVDVNFSRELVNEEKVYTNIYTVDLPHKLYYSEVIEDISSLESVIKVRTIQI